MKLNKIICLIMCVSFYSSILFCGKNFFTGPRGKISQRPSIQEEMKTGFFNQPSSQQQNLNTVLQQVNIFTITTPNASELVDLINTHKENISILTAIGNFIQKNLTKIIDPFVCKALLIDIPRILKQEPPEPIKMHYWNVIKKALVQEIGKYRNYFETIGVTFNGDFKQQEQQLLQVQDQQSLENKISEMLTPISINLEKFTAAIPSGDDTEWWKVMSSGNALITLGDAKLFKAQNPDKVVTSPVLLSKLITTFKESATGNYFKETSGISFTFPQLLIQLEGIENLYPIIKNIIYLGWNQAELGNRILEEKIWSIVTILGKRFNELYTPKFQELLVKQSQPKPSEAIPPQIPGKSQEEAPSIIPPQEEKNVPSQEKEPIAAKEAPSIPPLVPSPSTSPEAHKEKEEKKEAVIPPKSEIKEADEEESPQLPLDFSLSPTEKQIIEHQQPLLALLPHITIDAPNPGRFIKVIRTLKKSKSAAYQDIISKFLKEHGEKITDPVISKIILEEILPTLSEAIPDTIKNQLMKSYKQGVITHLEELRNILASCGVSFIHTLETAPANIDFSSKDNVQQLIVQALNPQKVDALTFVNTIDFSNKPKDDPELWKQFAQGTRELNEQNRTTLNDFLRILNEEKADKNPLPKTFIELKISPEFIKKFIALADFIGQDKKQTGATLKALSWEIIRYFIEAVELANKNLLTQELPLPISSKEPTIPTEELPETDITAIEPDSLMTAEEAQKARQEKLEKLKQQREEKQRRKEERQQKYKDLIADTKHAVEEQLEKLKEELEAQNLKNLKQISGKEYTEFPSLLPEHGKLLRPTITQGAEAVASLRHSLETLGLSFKRPVVPGWIDAYFWGGVAGYDALSSAIERIFKSEGLTKKTVESLLEVNEPQTFSRIEKERIINKVKDTLNLDPTNIDIRALFSKWYLWKKVQDNLLSLSPFFNTKNYIEQIALLILKILKPEDYNKLPSVITSPPIKTEPQEKKETPATKTPPLEIATATMDQKIEFIKRDLADLRTLFQPLLRRRAVTIPPEEMKKALESYIKTKNSASLFKYAEFASIPQLTAFFKDQKHLRDIIKNAHSFVKKKFKDGQRLLNNLETFNVVPLGYETTIKDALNTAMERSVSDYTKEKRNSIQAQEDEASKDKQLRLFLKELLETMQEPTLASFPTLAQKIKNLANSVKKQIIQIATDPIQKARSLEESLSVMLKEQNIQPWIEKLIPSDILDHPKLDSLFAIAPFTSVEQALKKINPATVLFKEAYADAQRPLIEFYTMHVEPLLSNFPQKGIEHWDRYKEYDEVFNKKLKALNYISSDIRETFSKPLVSQSLNIVIARNLKLNNEKTTDKQILVDEIEKIQQSESYKGFVQKAELDVIYNDAKAKLKSKEALTREAGAEDAQSQKPLTPEAAEQKAREQAQAAQEKARQKIEAKTNLLYKPLSSFRALLENLGFEFEKELPAFETFTQNFISNKGVNQAEILSLLQWKPSNTDPALNTLDDSIPLIEEACSNQSLFINEKRTVRAPADFMTHLLEGVKNSSLFDWFKDPQTSNSIPSLLKELESKDGITKAVRNRLTAQALFALSATLARAYIKKYRTLGGGAAAHSAVEKARSSSTPPSIETLLRYYDEGPLAEIAQANEVLDKALSTTSPIKKKLLMILDSYVNVINKAKTDKIPRLFKRLQIEENQAFPPKINENQPKPAAAPAA